MRRHGAHEATTSANATTTSGMSANGTTPNETMWPAISFADRMDTVRFDVSPNAHIVVDGRKCADCSTQACVVACPANLFVPTADGGIVFNYEQCFECGTCYLVCNVEGAVQWRYPEGGHGVVFRRS